MGTRVRRAAVGFQAKKKRCDAANARQKGNKLPQKECTKKKSKRKKRRHQEKHKEKRRISPSFMTLGAGSGSGWYQSFYFTKRTRVTGPKKKQVDANRLGGGPGGQTGTRITCGQKKTTFPLFKIKKLPEGDRGGRRTKAFKTNLCAGTKGIPANGEAKTAKGPTVLRSAVQERKITAWEARETYIEGGVYLVFAKHRLDQAEVKMELSAFTRDSSKSR